MTEPIPKENLPLRALGMFVIPIFAINLIFPAHPYSGLDIAIDHFLNEQLFGLIGFWSSLFPFSSKATGNYIALCGPLLSATSTHYAFTATFDSSQLDEMTLKRYLCMLLGSLILSTLLFWCFYLTSTDLGTTKGKYGNLFGINKLFFSTHNAAMSLFSFVLLPIILHRLFYYIPCRSIKKWMARKKEPDKSSKIVLGVANSQFFTPPNRNSAMQMTTPLLIVNPCDEEEDNMAMLCCHSNQGEMFLMTRYPDEDELEITLDGEPSTLDGVKVTFGPTRLLIEIAAADADALNGDDVLEITHATDAADLAEVEQTLRNILDGTGTYISEISEP